MVHNKLFLQSQLVNDSIGDGIKLSNQGHHVITAMSRHNVERCIAIIPHSLVSSPDPQQLRVWERDNSHSATKGLGMRLLTLSATEGLGTRLLTLSATEGLGMRLLTLLKSISFSQL